MSEVTIGTKVRLTVEDDPELTNYWGVAVGTEGEVLSGDSGAFEVLFEGAEDSFYVFPGEFEVIS